MGLLIGAIIEEFPIIFGTLFFSFSTVGLIMIAFKEIDKMMRG